MFLVYDVNRTEQDSMLCIKEYILSSSYYCREIMRVYLTRCHIFNYLNVILIKNIAVIYRNFKSMGYLY